MPQKTGRNPSPYVRVSTLYFYAFWESEKKRKYRSRRTNVFNDEGLNFVRSYEHLHDFYLRGELGKEPLMNYAELGAYLDFMLMLKRGQAWTLAEFAKARHIKPHTLVRYLDNLENINLLHRERSRDGSEHRIMIVLHSPLSPEDLAKQYPRLLRRRREGFVQKRRTEAGRNNRGYLPPAFSWTRLLKAFNGDERRAEKFETIATDVYHHNIAWEKFTVDEFIEKLDEFCQLAKDLHFTFSYEKHGEVATEIFRWLSQQ